MSVDLISKTSTGQQGTGGPTGTSIGSTATQGRSTVSADGRYVVFESVNTDLVAGDTNGLRDIFWHDRETGETRRVSVSSEGTQAVGPISANTGLGATISGDGRYVAFQSPGTNLVPGDTNNQSDIFVHDTLTGTTDRLDILDLGVNGLQSGGFSANPALSHDGRYVTFSSTANNLVAGDTNNTTDVFWHDRVTGETRRISVASVDENGVAVQANGASASPSISADGRFVVFQSSANNLVVGDTNGLGDIFVHDTLLGSTKRVSVSSPDENGLVTQSNGLSTSGAISADGAWAVFNSNGNLAGGPGDTGSDIFLHHLATGITTRIDVTTPDENGDVIGSNGNSNFPTISGDGRYIAWEEFGTNLTTGDTQPPPDIFLHDRLTGETSRVSVNAAGDPASGGTFSRAVSISADGGTLIYASNATNLLLPTLDTNGREDVFAISLLPETISLRLDEDPFAFVYAEDDVVLGQVAASAGLGLPDFDPIPLRLSAGGPPGAQAFVSSAHGVGVRSGREPPGLAGQTVNGTEFLRFDLDPSSPIDAAFSAAIDFGRVVTPGNRGQVTVTAFDDGMEVGSQTFAIRNGEDHQRLFESDVAFNALEISAADGNAISFTVTGITLGLASDAVFS